MNNEKYSRKIQKILDDGKKCKDKLLVVGPTGPTGPAGAATITVGTTTTGDPGTNASVTNSGTNENVILDFVIPAGPTGPQGIQGPTGPTGPAGTSVEAIYGSKYSTTNNNINVNENNDTAIPLATTGPTSGITSASTDTLTITETGIYRVDYFFNGSPSVAAELTLEVLQNTNPIGRTSITKEIEANADDILSGSAIVSLTEGDEIGLGLASNTTATVAPASGTNAYLDIVKIA